MSDYDGDCYVALRDAGLPTERGVVLQADERLRVSTGLLREIIAGSRHATFGEGLIHTGTEGEEMGVVTYEIDDPDFAAWATGRIDCLWLTARRVHR